MSAREFCYQIEREGYRARIVLLIALVSLLALTGCNKANGDPASQEAPPAAKVIVTEDANLFTVDHPERFPLATADARSSASELVVTGAVAPDVSRSVPVVSLASGRVMAIKARLGDTVEKGQLLLTVRSDDVEGGFSAYRKSVADEALARTKLERAKDLYEHGAMALNDFQVAQDTEQKAKGGARKAGNQALCVVAQISRGAHRKRRERQSP